MSERVVSVDVDRSPDAMLAYQLAKTIHRSGGNPASLFGLLDRLVQEESWKRLRDVHGNPFASFTELVETPEPYGLGTSRGELVKLLALRHPHEGGEEWRERAPKLREAVGRLLAEDIPKAADNGGDRVSSEYQVRATNLVQSDTADRTVARLKRDDPELAERVVNGEISANAAARQKGWRKPRVVLTSPQSVALRLREHFTAEQLAELIGLLLGGRDP